MVGLGRFGGWTLACACASALAVVGCTTGAVNEVVVSEQFSSIEDIDPLFGAYDLVMAGSGVDPRHQLMRPAPVGLAVSYDVDLQHEDAEGRRQGVTARLDVVVLISAADGSATGVVRSSHTR